MEGAFYYVGNGPAIIMIDNCDELRRSLHRNWPNTTLLLRLFNVIQQVWRWLHERQHGVSKDDRVQITKLFRDLVYAHDVEGYERAYENLFNFSKIQKYKNCMQYFEELCEINESWAKCLRTEKFIRKLNTNHYAEAQFVVVKDTILRRQRQYNINMLFDQLQYAL